MRSVTVYRVFAVVTMSTVIGAACAGGSAVKSGEGASTVLVTLILPIATATPAAATASRASEPVAFPQGVFRAKNTVDGVMTTEIRDGVWKGFKENGSLDCAGTYVVKAGRVWYSASTEPALDCGNAPGFQFLDAEWTMVGDQLRFIDINSDPAAVRAFGSAWTKIGE
jgi:hypothetical protein